VIIAAIGAHFHFSAAELDGLTAARALAWLDKLNKWREATKPKG
jgi:hypothetical protein